MAALAVCHQPQRHRDDVSHLLVLYVARRRRTGTVDPHRVIRTGPAVLPARTVQPVHLDARLDHYFRGDHARIRRLRQLDDPLADRRVGHGLRTHEQLQLLAAARRRHAVHGFVLRAWRRPGGRLDHVRPAFAANGPRHGLHHFRRPHSGRLVHHGGDQHHRHHPEPARSRHDTHENADVLLVLAGYRLPAAGRHARSGRLGHHAADRPPLRHHLLQRRRRRRPCAVSTRILVLRAPRGLHHDSAGLRHDLRSHPRVLAQEAVRLLVDGLRRLRHCHSVLPGLGAPHVRHRHARYRATVLHVRHHAHLHSHGREGVQLGRHHVARLADVRNPHAFRHRFYLRVHDGRLHRVGPGPGAGRHTAYRYLLCGGSLPLCAGGEIGSAHV